MIARTNSFIKKTYMTNILIRTRAIIAKQWLIIKRSTIIRTVQVFNPKWMMILQTRQTIVLKEKATASTNMHWIIKKSFFFWFQCSTADNHTINFH